MQFNSREPRPPFPPRFSSALAKRGTYRDGHLADHFPTVQQKVETGYGGYRFEVKRRVGYSTDATRRSSLQIQVESLVCSESLERSERRGRIDDRESEAGGPPLRLDLRLRLQ